MTWTATITERGYRALQEWLFRPDHDEHAAFLFAGLHRVGDSGRLLIRRVVTVADEDFTASRRGAYRAVSARAIARAARLCDDEGLCLLWAHSHPLSNDRVGFSPDDLDSHERMHPHLLDMTHGRPVAGLVLGETSVAGEIWLPNAAPMRLDSLRVIGPHLRDVRPEPLDEAQRAEGRFARQVLLFGDAGQAILRRTTVAIAGAGGGGSLLAESLAHLGVGRIIAIDFDRISESNLSRVVGATPDDAAAGRLKTEVLEELVARIDPTVAVTPVYGDITYTDDALRLADADFAFLATDTTFARYAFNAITHQYLIPGIQVGSKVSADDATGAIELIHVMERPVTLAGACLDCSGAINRDQLRREQLTDAERQAQVYVQGAGAEAIEDPSVITLNAISTSLATTDFLLMVTGLLNSTVKLEHQAYYPQPRELRRRPYDPQPGCRWCDPSSPTSHFAKGDLEQLPLRRGSRPVPEPPNKEAIDAPAGPGWFHRALEWITPSSLRAQRAERANRYARP